MMERLPRDLWIQIFLNLPVKTLLRCLSVCKSWQLFVQHPSFINSHLQHQTHDLMIVRIVTFGDDDGGVYNTTLAEKEARPERYSLYCDDGVSFTVYAKPEFPLHHPWGGHTHYRLVGICNGVVCLTSDEDTICHDTYLWNPTIQKCVKLPYPMFTFREIGPFDHELGFGFDEKTNDYKVVRIVERDDMDKAPLEVEIYSLSTGIWKKASHLASDLGVLGIFERWASGRNHQVYYNGALHWVGVNRNQSLCKVIAFHLGDEVFRCFEPPLGMKSDYRWIRKLRPVVFQGFLSLIHFIKPKCSVWMMKVYGDSTSWAKYLDIDLSDKVSRVIGSRKKGELILEILGALFSYKPIEEEGPISMDEINSWHWKLLQECYSKSMDFVDDHFSRHDLSDSEKNRLMYFVSHHRSFNYYASSYSQVNRFFCESYTESLVLVGKLNTTEVAKLGAKESERKHEDNNVADPFNEIQNPDEKSRQC